MINSQNGKRIVDLCIYIDENVYKENHDKEKIFDALYRIVYALSVKQKLFQNWADYEEFALNYASTLYCRLINPKQFLPDEHPAKLKKIKSILNYVKKTIIPAKVDFQQQMYAEQFDPALHKNAILDIHEKQVTSCRNQSKPILKIEFEYYLQKITQTIRWFLKTSTPYSDDLCMMHQLYNACLMTLLNQITLSNQNKRRFKNRLKNGYNVDDFLNHIYEEEREFSVVTFHLPEALKGYVAVCVNRIRKLIIKDLIDLIGSVEPSDAVIQSIIASSIGESSDKE